MDDNELLRILAKGTGWSVSPKNGQYELCYAPEEWCAFFETEADAWHYAEASVKDAPESVDAALALPWPWTLDTGDIYYTLRIERTPDGEHAVSLFRHDPYETPEGFEREEVTDITFVDMLLARALCEVFAQWAGAQEAKEGE